METRRLEYFLTLAKERSFRRAARSLFISQPALSQQIQRLEQEIGAILIDRSVTPFELTEAGRALLDNSNRILEELRQIEGVASRAREGLVGKLRVGIAPSLMYSGLPDLIRKFRASHPDVHFTLLREETSTILELVHQQRMDVGLLFSQRTSVPLEWQKLYDDSFVVVLPEGHALTGRPAVGIADLASETFMLLQRRGVPDLHDAIISACANAGFSPRSKDVEFQAEGAGFVDQIGLVAAGFGIALIPAAVATLTIRGVVYRPLVKPSIMLPTSACWSVENKNPSISRFIEFCSSRETA
ncbi:LysR family transcriptional regulator [Gryllotalpicola koreensis]|uniref:LysR family transcriptional regulator n=1 Tax=Gryllotalpicola koreensis TaxID=993086 RepID=A0ABP8AA62_9MICO